MTCLTIEYTCNTMIWLTWLNYFHKSTAMGSFFLFCLLTGTSQRSDNSDRSTGIHSYQLYRHTRKVVSTAAAAGYVSGVGDVRWQQTLLRLDMVWDSLLGMGWLVGGACGNMTVNTQCGNSVQSGITVWGQNYESLRFQVRTGGTLRFNGSFQNCLKS